MTAAWVEVAWDLARHREIREIAFEDEEVYRIVTTNSIHSHSLNVPFWMLTGLLARAREPVKYELKGKMKNSEKDDYKVCFSGATI